ncbi:MAG: CDP-diacylglycerol--serine O-phosphatidyltransferase [Acidobacteriaceae bacterium]|nr:CDP-diacylglycerol--serine O-phosphatidyltransferase [Acidobacteriaceae bacterium]MBV8570766.1 CDP-diacylglycerol--serine O-phosphatidyltransferase [Acidobacteriaceae bacterium]
MQPLKPGKPPRRAAYALPTLFTSGNIFLGFLAIVQAFEGAMQAGTGDLGPNQHFSLAAKALGFSVFFDGLDGRIARMTHTTSDFGRELDSLADVVTFGIAPAILAFVWGVRYVISAEPSVESNLIRAGYLVVFFYLLCGAVRLARFNIQKPQPSGRPDYKYFVGMPIPAAAAFIAAVVYMDDAPVRSLAFAVTWLVIIGLIGLLMVSTWRYPSLKQVNITKPRTPLFVLIVGGFAFLIWEWSQPFLLALSSAYVVSGIAIRAGSFMRRRRKPRAPVAEQQLGRS